VELYGAPGGAGSGVSISPGGAGGIVRGFLLVPSSNSASQTLWVTVGGPGEAARPYNSSVGAVGGKGGFPNGGNGGSSPAPSSSEAVHRGELEAAQLGAGGGGGGGSYIAPCRELYECEPPLVEAGGGGGGGGEGRYLYVYWNESLKSYEYKYPIGIKGPPGGDATQAGGRENLTVRLQNRPEYFFEGGGPGGGGTSSSLGSGGAAARNTSQAPKECGFSEYPQGVAGGNGAGAGGAGGGQEQLAGGGGGGGGYFSGGGGGTGLSGSCLLNSGTEFFTVYSPGGGGGGGGNYEGGTLITEEEASGSPKGRVTITRVTPPVAEIISQPPAKPVGQGAIVETRFSCREGFHGNSRLGLKACSDSSGTVVAGENKEIVEAHGKLATTTPGINTYTVKAEAADTLSATSSFTYTVAEAPHVELSSPQRLPFYRQGSEAVLGFACIEGKYGTGLSSCVPSTGSAVKAEGEGTQKLEGSVKLGTQSLGGSIVTVKAKSFDGATSESSYPYDVVNPPTARIE